MPIHVGCISLGCPKNLIDSEIMLGLLEPKTFEITTNMQEAEAIIVNTCAFIGDAREEAVDTILEAAQYKKTGKLKALIVAGCLVQKYRDEIIKEIPEVDAILGTANIPDIAKVILDQTEGKGEKKYYIEDPTGVEYLDNLRMLSKKGPTQYLKIAEGCSNFCTYCIIPVLRGPYHSRTLESIMLEAKKLVEQGTKEIILIAQDVSRFGEDLYGEARLVELIRELSGIDGLQWIRLLYCYPERVTDELIQELKNNPKLLKYLDIPIQHASDKILKAMGRKSRRKELAHLYTTLKGEIPEIILRTTLITGFPGETKEDFIELEKFIQAYPFDRLGVFAYSQEEGTPAGAMENQVNALIRQKRRDKILSIQQTVTLSGMKKRIGQLYPVLVEGVAEDGIFYYGRSYGEAPEIDPLVYFTSMEPVEIGSFVRVEVLDIHQMDLVGKVDEDESAE